MAVDKFIRVYRGQPPIARVKVEPPEEYREEDEAEFRFRVANVLRSYDHEVYFHDPGFGPQFHMHKAKGYVDLYIKTSPEWVHHDKFPVIGVETKLSKSLGWLIDAFYQVDKYRKDLRNALYEIDGELVPVPTIFLVCTSDSFYEGQVYRWPHPKFTPEQLGPAWEVITDMYDRFLYKSGAALMRRNVFYTNMFGNHGAVTRYELW
ncbi:MAG TPA: hypothetical protein GXX51_06905 [Firmicutes bacterium]|nr:hypothetical protein [Bacillota bacterium]